MSTQIHLNMVAGSDFTHKFEVKNFDLSARNITGFTLYARMSKHSGAMNAVSSTSSDVIYKTIPLTAEVTDGVNGIYTISLPDETTSKLKSGKYVYSVNMENGSGDLEEVNNGLIYVTETVRVGSNIDPNYP